MQKRNLRVTGKNVHLNKLLAAGLTAMIVHPTAPTAETFKFSYRRFREKTPDSVTWHDEEDDCYVSMVLNPLPIERMPEYISRTGNYLGDKDLIHFVYVLQESGEYIYDGQVFDDVHEDVLREEMSRNYKYKRAFFATDIANLSSSKGQCAHFLCKEVGEMPDTAELCNDISQMEPYDVVYIGHRGGVMACTLTNFFQMIDLKDVRNIVADEPGMTYIVENGREVVQEVEDVDTPGIMLLWNDTFFNKEDTWHLEESIGNEIYS